MIILQVNNVYNRLSTGKIVADIHHELEKIGHDSYVCYARGPLVNEKHVYKFNWEFYAHINKIRGILTGIPYGGNFLSTFYLIRIIKKIKPDVVHLHCINDDSLNIYRLFKYLKEKHIKTVVTLHAEFLYTGTCGHALDCEKWKTGCGNCPQIKNKPIFIDSTHCAWMKMAKSLCGFNKEDIYITSVSPWLLKRAKQSPIIGEYRHCVVFNGIDTNYFNLKTWSMKDRISIGLSDRPVLMYVTSSFPATAKGGNFVLELATKMPEIDILVLGSKTSESNIPINIKLLGRIYDRNRMALCYSMSSATLLTSPRETFSMPVAESMCCGTPVVGFEAGGPESIAIKSASKFVKYGNLDELINEIKNVINESIDRKALSSEAQSIYSKENMTLSYINIYNQLVKHD